jgi:error-prone DNA polymerase
MAGYVELHCHSNFSLLDGASHPEDLAARAKQLKMPALALTDHDGLYGAIRFYRAARQAGIKPIIGAEVTVDQEYHLTLLARNKNGYSNLCRLITRSHLGSSKGNPSIEGSILAEYSTDLICLSGCRKGKIANLLLDDQMEQADAIAREYLEVFGRDGFFIELQNNLKPGDKRLCQQLAELARDLDIRCVATNNVHYATQDRHRLQDVLVCIKNGTTLDKSAHLRRPNSEFYLKSAAEMSSLYRGYPEALKNTIHIADACNVDLDFSSYRFPQYPLPEGETNDSYLAGLCREKARERYGHISEEVSSQLKYELDLISRLSLSGYFLIVYDMMEYARINSIPAQGRGSAANSIVAYILGITKVDPIRHNLFIGRFINEEMSSLPDIDIDVSTNHREQLIKYVYEKYGEEHTAMVCTYVTFQSRNAIREVGKALGMPASTLDQMAKATGSYSSRDINKDLKGLDQFRSYVTSAPWHHFISLCREIADFPRHLSIHVGGMIISSCPLTDIVPLERASMPGRVICQWDKDGVEDAGLVKVDILGLRMLSLIDEAVQLAKQSDGIDVDLDKIPLDDQKVYDMICRADTVGVFQVESRAQIQTLPRTKPRSIEDLTVEVAIIRPGPLQGNMVHPYIRRRQGKEKVTYPHRKLRPILQETLGVILFQEQVLRAAIAIAGFSPGEADSLRRAMSRKRSRRAMEEIRQRFQEGAANNDISRSVASRIFRTLEGFAEYGFCKSHAAGFALLAYQSAWLKHYYPTEFYAALLNNQPMGFYSPEVIVGDAKRHGVEVLPVNINHSSGRCTVDGGKLRLGFRYVKEMGEAAVDDIERARAKAPFSSLRDLYQRTGLSREAVENLILAGALDAFGIAKRQLLWELGILERQGRDRLMLECPEYQVPLPGMTDWEELSAEYDVQGLSPGSHPMQLLRADISKDGVLKSSEVLSLFQGTRIRTAGYVVCRQAPGTAKGHVFLTLEDEEGLLNIVLRPRIYQKHRYLVRTEPLIVVEGVLQKREGISNIIAERITTLRQERERQQSMYPAPEPRARNFG